MTMAQPDASQQPASVDAIDSVLHPLLNGLEELERCLEAESAALIDGGAGRLLTAVDEKRRALRTVEAVMNEPRLRAMLTRTASEDYAPSAAIAGASSSLNEPTASPAWQNLMARLTRCRDLNQAAGGAIASSRRSTDQLLHLLGRAPEPGTYGVDGSAPSETGGRDLAVC